MRKLPGVLGSEGLRWDNYLRIHVTYALQQSFFPSFPIFNGAT